VEKHWKSPQEVVPRLRLLRESFAKLDTWDHDSLEGALRALADQLGIPAGKLIHPLRVALTGSAVGPGVFEVAAVLGRDAVLTRLDAAIEELGTA
jgi:glutamyl-tRNA synthetase